MILLKQLLDNSDTEDFMSQLPGVINRDCIVPICKKLMESPDYETAEALDVYVEHVIRDSMREAIYIMSCLIHYGDEQDGGDGPVLSEVDTRWMVENLRKYTMEYCNMYYEISLSALKAIKHLVPKEEGGAQ